MNMENISDPDGEDPNGNDDIVPVWQLKSFDVPADGEKD